MTFRAKLIIGSLLGAGIVLSFLLYRGEYESNSRVDQKANSTVATRENSDYYDRVGQPTIDGNVRNTQDPKELISSIYDFGPDYRDLATRVVEDTIQHYDPSSYVRWSPVRIEPLSYLNWSYLEEDALPNAISITLFPDVSYVATQTEYQIFSDSEGAIWYGSIHGSEDGRVEITIVGGARNPSFVIRVIDHPNLYQVFPTDAPNVYMVVEPNPNQILSEHQD